MTNLIALLIVSVPPLIFRHAIDELIPAKDMLSINILFVFVFVIYMANAGFRLANIYIRWYLGQHIGYDIRKKMLDVMLYQCQRFYSTRVTGEITSRLNNDVKAVGYLSSQAIFDLTSAMLQIGITLVFLFYLSWQLTLVIIGLSILMFICVVVNMNFHKKLRKRISEKWGKMLGFLQETIANIRVVKAFSAENKEASRHVQKSRELIKDNILSGVIQRVFWIIGIVFWNLFALASILFGVRLIAGGSMSLGVLFAFVIYIRSFFMPIFQLSNVVTNIIRSFISVDRIYEYIEAPNEIVTKKDSQSVHNEKGEIAFDRVSFSYSGDEKDNVLSDISLKIEDGESVAFVGPSGAGKSTLFNLIIRYFDPTQGKVLFNRRDLRDLDLDSYREHLSVVFQDALLFNDSIGNNVGYAKEGATQEEIERACKDAQILDFIQELPEGYETVIGERGVKLSGGQRQRLSIARAILKNPKILLLDEATSSVDSISENRIQGALDKIMQNRTTILIAHRLTTVINVDRICAIEDGRIVESGSHTELLAKEGLYHRLWTTQMKERGVAYSVSPSGIPDSQGTPV